MFKFWTRVFEPPLGDLGT